MNGETHNRSIVVWDVPPAIERGAAFSIKVGLKCSFECMPEKWALEIRDHAGNAVAPATPGREPWPGTAGLYYTEVQLTAPDGEGLYAWEALAPAVAVDGETLGALDAARPCGHDHEEAGPVERQGGSDMQRQPHEAQDRHDEARATFNVRVVPAPACRLTIVAVDKERQSPVKGAKVVVHPYRAFTDERGIAEVRVPKGAYRLFVSGRDYFPFRSDGEVAADVTITAELEKDSGPSDAELWS